MKTAKSGRRMKKAMLTLLALGFTGHVHAAMINVAPNPGFETVGPNGPSVFEPTPPYLESVAKDWFHYHPVPDSFVLTELLPSSDPLPGGGGNMLSFLTDEGLFVASGNGVFADFLSIPVGSVGSLDMDVVSGTGRLGFVNNLGAFDSGSVDFGPTSGWQHFTFANFDSPTSRIGFEIFSAGGGEMFVDNAFVPLAVPEPTTLLLCGPGVLGLIGYRWRERRPITSSS